MTSFNNTAHDGVVSIVVCIGRKVVVTIGGKVVDFKVVCWVVEVEGEFEVVAVVGAVCVVVLVVEALVNVESGMCEDETVFGDVTGVESLVVCILVDEEYGKENLVELIVVDGIVVEAGIVEGVTEVVEGNTVEDSVGKVDVVGRSVVDVCFVNVVDTVDFSGVDNLVVEDVTKCVVVSGAGVVVTRSSSGRLPAHICTIICPSFFIYPIWCSKPILIQSLSPSPVPI